MHCRSRFYSRRRLWLAPSHTSSTQKNAIWDKLVLIKNGTGWVTMTHVAHSKSLPSPLRAKWRHRFA